MHLFQVQNLLVSNCRGGESPLVMELGTPGCTGLKSTILAMLFTILTTCKVSSTTMLHLLLVLPAVTADPNSFTMSAGQVDFRLQLAFFNLHYQTLTENEVLIKVLKVATKT